MKKMYVAMALGFVCAVFMACGNKITEQQIAERMVYDDIINTFHPAPEYVSMIKLLETKVTPHEAQMVVDTFYHISEAYKDPQDSWCTIIVIDVDSIRMVRREYPAYNDYYVTYEIKHPISYADHKLMSNGQEYNSKIYDSPVSDEIKEYKRRFTTDGTGFACSEIILGSWASIYVSRAMNKDDFHSEPIQ